jgi:5,6-dimethylbenzimidazole synthase
LILLTFNKRKNEGTKYMTDDFTEEEKRGFYKAIYSRRDVRSHFISRSIEDNILSKILNAAHHAPSVGFSQPWNFILIKDIKTKKKIKESFEKEKNRSSQLVEEPKKSKYLSFKLEGILESPINLCVTYDPTKFGPFVIGRSSIPDAGLYSVCCAIQNLWLSARTEGVGLGWVSILSNDTLKETLELPEHVIPVAYLCLGYVDEFAEKPDLEIKGWLPRLELKDVVYFEKWNDTDNENWDIIQNMIKNNLDYA